MGQIQLTKKLDLSCKSSNLAQGSTGDGIVYSCAETCMPSSALLASLLDFHLPLLQKGWALAARVSASDLDAGGSRGDLWPGGRFVAHGRGMGHKTSLCGGTD